jgi:glycosyltransferase involved in cell wall biosynthesis
MRILMLSWEYPPHVIGGMGRHVMDLAPALVAEGVELHILTPLLRGGAASEVSAQGVHVHRVELSKATDDGQGPASVAFVQQMNVAMERAALALRQAVGDFALIHAHDWLTAQAGIALKHTWRRPLVTTIHATERGRRQGYLDAGHAEQINDLEWLLTYEAWRVIACSRFMAAQLGEYFNTPHDKIDVVPNGIYVRPSPFGAEEERRAYRQRFAGDDQPLAFYVGRIVYEKGLHVLLEAWPRVLERFPRARLVIAGTGACLEVLRIRARDLGLSDSVLFTGFIPDEERDRFYAIADVAVFPSIYEPFGIVALEAMGARCPVVVTATGGLAEVVIPHETGLTVCPNDPESLAWGILHTLQHPEWARARAENGFRVVCDAFNWHHIAAMTVEVYERTYTAWRQNGWGTETLT